MPGEEKRISFILDQHKSHQGKNVKHTVKTDEPELRRKGRTKTEDLSVLPT